MRIFLGLILLLSLTTASAQVYRWTDDKGVVHYGDKPLASNAKPVELPPLQTYSPSGAVPSNNESGIDAPSAVQDSKPPVVRIASPAPDETIRDAERKLSVSVDVVLAPTQGLLYFLDGAQQNKSPTASLAYLIENVERGEHTISAAVATLNGKVLSRSEPITIHMKPPIVPPPPARPPPASR